MLKNFIIHLKNIIFFKSIVCLVSIFSLCGLLQNVNEDYVDSVNKNKISEKFLTKETLNIYSVINSKNKLLDIYAKYFTLLSVSTRQSCLERAELIERIASLSVKYGLHEPIDTSIKQEFSNKVASKMEIGNNVVRLRNYDVKIRFASKDFATFLAIIKEIYSYMPKNTIILSVEVMQEEVLYPKMIYKLSHSQKPNLIFTKLNMRIREITANR